MSQRLRVLLPLGVGVAAILAALPFLRSTPDAETDKPTGSAASAEPDVLVDDGDSPAGVALQVTGDVVPPPRERAIVPPAIEDAKPAAFDSTLPPELPGAFPAPALPTPKVETLSEPSAFQPAGEVDNERLAQRTFVPEPVEQRTTASEQAPTATTFPARIDEAVETPATPEPKQTVPSVEPFVKQETPPAVESNTSLAPIAPIAPPSPSPSQASPQTSTPPAPAQVEPTPSPLPSTFTPTAPSTPTTPATPTPTRSPSTIRRHTIRDGDTLQRIAERYLGDEKFSDAIYNANRDVLPQRDLLPIGAELAIPAVESP